MILLTNKLEFPPHYKANEFGILALGGDLSTDRLVLAYKNGIFPWYNQGEPITWYSPIKRMVLFTNELKISKTMKKILKKQNFTITENKAFKEVIFNCKTIARKNQIGTWITERVEKSYINLYKKGIAKSIEVWNKNELVGGLYGIDLKNGVFCGESMFAKESNMSKVAFIYLAKKKEFSLIDCQVYNRHLASLGAREIYRKDFLNYLT